MKKKSGTIGIIVLINLVLSNVIVLGALNSSFAFGAYIKCEVFLFVLLMLFSNVFFSNKFCSGKAQEWLFFLSVALIVSFALAFLFYSFIKSDWKIKQIIAWGMSIKSILNWDWLYFGLTLGFFIGVVAFYCGIFDRELLRSIRTSGLIGKGKIKSIEANLENSRWMSKEEKQKNFKTYRFTKLNEADKDGVPVWRN